MSNTSAVFRPATADNLPQQQETKNWRDLQLPPHNLYYNMNGHHVFWKPDLLFYYKRYERKPKTVFIDGKSFMIDDPTTPRTAFTVFVTPEELKKHAGEPEQIKVKPVVTVPKHGANFGAPQRLVMKQISNEAIRDAKEKGELLFEAQNRLAYQQFAQAMEMYEDNKHKQDDYMERHKISDIFKNRYMREKHMKAKAAEVPQTAKKTVGWTANVYENFHRNPKFFVPPKQ